MTAGAGGSWSYRPAFNLQLVGAVSLATPAGFAGFSIPGGTIPALAAWGYKVVACIDGPGNIRSASSAPFVFVRPGSIGANVITWAATPGARCYRVYRDSGSGLFQFFDIAYTNGTIDWGTAGTYATDFLPFGGVLAQSFYNVDMAPAVYNPADPRWLERSKASVDGVFYTDLSQPEEMQSFNRALLTKEFGVRVSVNMTFRVVAGSAEENDLASIYGAKLAFPDGPTAIGAQVQFTLASSRLTQGYKQVRLVGDFTRTPSIGQKNAINIFSWKIMAVDALPSVPNFESTTGNGLW